MVDVYCANCNAPLRRSPRQIRASRTGLYFCNQGCMLEWRKNNLPDWSKRKPATLKDGTHTITQSLVYSAVTTDWQSTKEISAKLNGNNETIRNILYTLVTYKLIIKINAKPGKRTQSYWIRYNIDATYPEQPKSGIAPKGYKICSGCGETKLLSEYHKDASSRDGLSCRCKTCVNSRWKARYVRSKRNIDVCRKSDSAITYGGHSGRESRRDHDRRKRLVKNGLASFWLPYRKIDDIKIGVV